MTLDLSQFRGVFFEECFESLDSMEQTLLGLTVGAVAAEDINTIFRGAHSIKGGSATFGFAQITQFTHRMETVLDEIRAGRMELTPALLDLLLKSVDAIREMLRTEQAEKPVDPNAGVELLAALGELSREKRECAVVALARAGKNRWQLKFRPYPQAFDRGIDPLQIVRELRQLGALTVRGVVSSLPTLAELNPRACYLAWEFELDSDISDDGIRLIFEWAEGDCDLEIRAVPTGNAAAAVETVAASDGAAAAAEGPALLVNSAVNSKASGPDAGSIRVSVEKIDELMNTVGELVITQAMLSQLATQLEGPGADPLRAGLAQLERNMRVLQESVMRVRMLPISFVFSRFPRMVRDLSQRLDKQIELKLTGEHTELDKTVLEKIGDPLVHLVRNSIDHGIECADKRRAAGKPTIGTVHLEANQKGGNISITVSDDGAGLNTQRILDKARQRGLVDANESLSDEQIHDLIFMPGFSTVEQTTDVSGRGVGMDVVRRNVKDLGGSIDVRSVAGQGSRFVITLPLTLAIVDGQTVSVGSETYIVPIVSIIESLQLKPEMVNRISAHGEVFWFRDSYLPIVRLHRLFGVEPRSRSLCEGLIMVVEGDGRRVGLFVDDLLGQQQVVIKSLDANYGHIEGVSGATILGDGSVALILDLPGIIHSASLAAAAA